MPNRSNQSDYRKTITEWFEQKQKNNARFSFGALARKLGYSSTSSLSNVLSGKRSLSSKHAKILAEIMELPPGPARQFLDAVAAEKMSRKGFDTDTDLSTLTEATFDQKPLIPNVKLAHFVACSKVGSGLSTEAFADACEMLTREFAVDGRAIFEELITHNILEHVDGVVKPIGNKSGVNFSMSGSDDRKLILGVAQEIQQRTGKLYLENKPDAGINLAVLRVRPEDIENLRHDLLVAMRDVYQRYSHGAQLSSLVVHQSSFSKIY